MHVLSGMKLIECSEFLVNVVIDNDANIISELEQFLGAAPTPTFVDQRAAADNLSARRRCHVAMLLCIYFFAIVDFRLLKKSSENCDNRTKFFRESLEKAFFWPSTPLRAAPT